MKNILTILIIVLSSVRVFADGSVAQQKVQLSLLPVIEITSAQKQSITAGISKSSSETQTFNVRSNKGFKISVSTLNANENINLSLVNNNTGGKATTNSNNIPVSMSAQDIIANCSRGNQQSFAVNYKVKSNSSVVYTATQP